MGEWIRVCGLAETPQTGEVKEVEVDGVSVCVANVEGELSALDNWCPHRRGPLGQGWIEGRAVVCPWHSWAFDAKTGVAQYPEDERVAAFPVKIEGDGLWIDLSARSGSATDAAIETSHTIES